MHKTDNSEIKNKVMISRGKVVNIGKLKILKSDSFPYVIPTLSFLVVEEAKDVFASTCIQLHIDGDGSTAEEAITEMEENVIEFLKSNFREDRKETMAWENIEELFSLAKSNSELWDTYETLQVCLAKQDIETDFTTKPMKRNNATQTMQTMQTKQTKQTKQTTIDFNEECMKRRKVPQKKYAKPTGTYSGVSKSFFKKNPNNRSYDLVKYVDGMKVPVARSWPLG